ncbi:bifunctional [glutamate--ammonia ligase]-adenylyl-L-tyrosine phosphorylase/[glutamate--ammonia-ligase] adenylyltransferase [Solilutibacter silvestris]|uniref:Bifunctional glutamine synthetase adenylyltransferase/adenylyl-removing enzyme n=1 Tax=Solilutibacter silvestris TaxID=1645665 RepID=A0A2K1Q0D3_9GAMM|nr:bifunctional [glutamate--ammonia ligase]-adenylyl-L-tyrosine phosphorylase/[glutamate--ammonia-ligase] adenylyltransferase [Lysobacter silvestris]PNS08500.1 Glutamine synthetase adenylyltransferase [Lysobacter silvestris]
MFDPAAAIATLDLKPSATDDAALSRLRTVATSSDFAIETLRRQPDVLRALLHDDGTRPFPRPELAPDRRDAWPSLLRRYRQAESTRLVWRDVLGLDSVEETLRGSSRLAEQCLALALTALERDFAERHGVVRAADGGVQRLVVFALGKLGGGELNFSSDIDIVFAYPEDGASDGARPLDAEQYFARLGQQLAKLLDEVTAEGFSHRVDLRLRPYGNAGRMAWSFSALEQYFQREGRDWERYAWQKARPVAGDIDAGELFLRMLRPFVYRRYLDFGALEGLREMKALIAAEVARREMQDDIKRGPGGIREIEFLAQALQLIRGGREPALQQRGLLAALDALVTAGQMDAAVGAALRDDYRFLRRLENRLQMLRDAQTYAFPESPGDRERIATTLGHADWDGLLADLDVHRVRVANEFSALLGSRRDSDEKDGLSGYWRSLPDGGEASLLAGTGFADVESADQQLRQFVRGLSPAVMSDVARARLDRLMPALLATSGRAAQPDLALSRALSLVQNVLRRSNYLALLDEQPQALERLIDALSRSALLGERVAAHPVLLDELLDRRAAGDLPDAATMGEACARALEHGDGDVEQSLVLLNETRQALSFRIALAALDGQQPASASTQQLAWLADAVVASVVRLAWTDLVRAHGRVADARFAVLGYGSVGGEELGFGSDLDLVFLHDGDDTAQSDGARPLDATRWFARLAQKIVSLLQTPTRAGRLYDVDMRLRPDGASGLLVTSLAAYADYQRHRAWTWEHQALVRARCVMADPEGRLANDFDAVRAEVLEQSRDATTLAADVIAMRQRMRRELDRGDARWFDLKQGEGGLVDLEFLLQALVLRHADAHPRLCVPRRSVDLIAALAGAGILASGPAAALLHAHATLSSLGLACTLDRRPRRVQFDAVVDAARSTIRDACRAHGLDFSAAPASDA